MQVGFGRGSRRALGVLALSGAVAFSMTAVDTAPADATHRAAGHAAHWTGTWAASPTVAGDDGPAAAGFDDATVRDVVHTSVGGKAVRIRLSNTFGEQPLTIDEATVAVRDEGAGIRPGTLQQVTFGGARTFTIPVGAQVYSDPVRMRVRPLSDLAVSLYFDGPTGPVTQHPLGTSTTYIAPDGNSAHATGADAYTESAQSWFVIDGVDVRGARQAGSVVTLGNSITDGYASTPDANHRWPDLLARRLQRQHGRKPLGVLNAGISGNRVLTDAGTAGVSAQARFDRDVLAQSGVRTVVVMEGINDIGNDAGVDGGPLTARQLIAGLKNIARRAHARGLSIIGGTLTPYKGAGYFSPRGERIRQRVNHWIRTGDAFDGLVDFDKVTRDPQHPRRFLPRYDSGDHLHPSDAGYRAMAGVVRLKALYR